MEPKRFLAAEIDAFPGRRSRESVLVPSIALVQRAAQLELFTNAVREDTPRPKQGLGSIYATEPGLHSDSREWRRVQAGGIAAKIACSSVGSQGSGFHVQPAGDTRKGKGELSQLGLPHAPPIRPEDHGYDVHEPRESCQAPAPSPLVR